MNDLRISSPEVHMPAALMLEVDMGRDTATGGATKDPQLLRQCVNVITSNPAV